jgi:hypothetical protein
MNGNCKIADLERANVESVGDEVGEGKEMTNAAASII